MKTLRVIFYTLITSLFISACGENEGTVKTDDCREIIYIKEKSVEKKRSKKVIKKTIFLILLVIFS
jgi:hypothetical protein